MARDMPYSSVNIYSEYLICISSVAEKAVQPYKHTTESDRARIDVPKIFFYIVYKSNVFRLVNFFVIFPVVFSLGVGNKQSE